jgi:hypothetical protein
MGMMQEFKEFAVKGNVKELTPSSEKRKKHLKRHPNPRLRNCCSRKYVIC